MTKEYLDRILTWSDSLCLLDAPSHYIHFVMTSSEPSALLGEWAMSKKMKLTVTRHLEQLACTAVGFMLWTRNYELVKLKRGDIKIDRTAMDGVFLKYLRGEERSLTINELRVYFEVHLRNRKGWQRKLDKGVREIDLRSQSHLPICLRDVAMRQYLTAFDWYVYIGNHYQVYPRPDMGKACDAFVRLLFWMRWVEVVHLGRLMAEDDFLFPAVGANGVLQPGEPLSHDMVQRWIDEAVTGARIPGSFSTHCYRRSGAQYRFMYAPVGQWWTLAWVQWWGGWAEGEHCDTLMCYLLNELHCYENDHSDALAPDSHEANGSFAGEAALVRPASTEELRMAHASLTADVASLKTDVASLKTDVATLQTDMAGLHSDVREISQQLSMVTQVLVPTSAHSASTVCCPGANNTRTFTHCHRHLSARSRAAIWLPLMAQRVPAAQSHLPTLGSPPVQPTPMLPIPFMTHPSQVGPQRASTYSTSSAPPLGLFILNVPVLHVDGTRMPKSDSWKDIVCHWTKGEPRLGLSLPLRDWPHRYYNGPSTEFLDEFQGNEGAFLEAYGCAAHLGHTKLLKAILDTRKEHHGNGERRRHFTTEVHSSAAMLTVPSTTTEQQ
ncbi:hypothetical protein EDC04DRAFT_2908510 [Pisolithus marmoratus]|nr:hypothetical protein EDC04DRAFT_2908510 [Pisolithus marmoratus]